MGFNDFNLDDEEEKYHKYIGNFMREELENDFSRIEKHEALILETYALSSMEYINDSVKGVEGTPVEEFMSDEIRLALKIGYTLCAINNRYSMENANFQKYLKKRKSFSFKKLIINTLDIIRNKLDRNT